ncbi:hypothetical protein Acsp01_25680 [Actinoplanes sp. NBRC 101535]|nr:hypothetical protein Acsp01_25680 [Actinoplanes sp. NBRC 101535]
MINDESCLLTVTGPPRRAHYLRVKIEPYRGDAHEGTHPRPRPEATEPQVGAHLQEISEAQSFLKTEILRLMTIINA